LSKGEKDAILLLDFLLLDSIMHNKERKKATVWGKIRSSMFCFLLQKQKINTKGERENRERDLREFLQEKKNMRFERGAILI